MAKKSLLLAVIVLLTGAVNMTGIALFHFRPIFGKSVFLLLITVCLLFVFLRRRNWYTPFENGLVCLTVFCMVFIFNVFGPIFVDRSLSYHMILASADNNIRYTEKSITEKTGQGIYRKRVKELQLMGLLQELPDGTVKATRAGQTFSNVALAIGKMTDSLEEYDGFSGELKAGKNEAESN